MRVGRPVKALPQPICDYCGAKAALVKSDEEAYPYREDHGPLWVCAACEAWIGVFARSTRYLPLGRLANAELRERKAKLHATLEPMVEAKVRRDGCNTFEARAKGYRWLANELKIDEKKYHIHLLSVDQCKGAIGIVDRFERDRHPDAPPKTS